MLDVEPLAVELVLLVLGRVLLPLLVLGVSLRTCLVTLSQHFIAPGAAALGDGVVVEVWATAIPMLPASIAAAISPIPVIRIRPVLPRCRSGPASLRRGVGEQKPSGWVPRQPHVKKRTPVASGGSSSWKNFPRYQRLGCAAAVSSVIVRRCN